ncbi:MAG: cytochrome c biogenesis protein CcsA [Methylocystaceae bacterium]
MVGEARLVIITLVIYLLAGILIYITRDRKDQYWVLGCLAGGLFFHTALLIGRIVKSGHLPISSLYEFTILLSWILIIIALLMAQKDAAVSIRLTLPVLSGMLLVTALTQSPAIHPLPPALRSYWLQVHVIIAVIAYSAFALAFVLSLVWLVKPEVPGSKNDQLLYRIILLGFGFHTLVLITGAIWAEQAWGTWWSWDPKETWALITWLVYAYYLHRRQEGNMYGKSGVWFGVVGFAVVMFTLFGVSLWFPGLHSYK